MDIDYYAQLEIRLDRMQTQIDALETAVLQIPQINMQSDPSRPQGVVVEPTALSGL